MALIAFVIALAFLMCTHYVAYRKGFLVGMNTKKPRTIHTH